MSKIFLCMALTLLCSCQHVQHTHQPVVPSVGSVPQMIFLTFSMHADSLRADHIVLINKKIVTGELKAQPENSNLQDRLVVKQLNAALQEVSSCSIDHPLIKRAEYPNGQQGFESKTINLMESEFFVRVPLQSSTKFILVEEIVANKNVSSATFKIKD